MVGGGSPRSGWKGGDSTAGPGPCSVRQGALSKKRTWIGGNHLDEGAVARNVLLDPGRGHDVVAQLVLGDRACRAA
jgi:hypothetical protein